MCFAVPFCLCFKCVRLSCVYYSIIDVLFCSWCGVLWKLVVVQVLLQGISTQAVVFARGVWAAAAKTARPYA